MVYNARERGTAYTFSLRAESLTLGVGDERVFAWDAGGRLYSLTDGDRTWRRGLSGALMEKGRVDGETVRTWLTGAAADEVVDGAADMARTTLAAMDAPEWTWLECPVPRDETVLRARLGVCSCFDAGAARLDTQRFGEVYDPIGMLPPDQYLALVVQATRGCTFNTCTFCELYRDGYAVKTPEDFERHLDAVLTYLGDSVRLRSRTLFLGAANALAVPMARLEPLFEILARRADAMARGVGAFVDGFTGQRKTAPDYARLRQLGLRRVYVGLESGHDPLLRSVRKPSTAAETIEAVATMKVAGLAVGVIVMTGLGGVAFADAHVRDTASVLTAMELGRGDRLYFSELVEVPRHADLATAHGRLATEARRQQREAILGATAFAGEAPSIATYDIREFVY